MLRTKLITLACVAMLALGMSSNASADPISVTGTVDVNDFSNGLALYEFTVSVNVDVLVGLGVFFDGALDISSWSFFDSTVPTPANVTADWVDTFLNPFCDSSACDLNFDNFLGVAAFDIFTFNVIVDVGDAISNLGSLTDPFMAFYSCGTTAFDSFECDPYWYESEFFTSPVITVLSSNGNGGGATKVPEPGTLGLLGLGLLAMGAARRRKKIA